MNESKLVSRRTLAAGTAWAVPAVAVATAAPAMAASPWDMSGTGWTYISYDAQHLAGDDKTCVSGSTIQYTLDSTGDTYPDGYRDGYYVIEPQGESGTSVVTGLYWTYTLPTPYLKFTIDTTRSTAGWVDQGEIGTTTYSGKTYYQYRFYLAGPITLPWTKLQSGGTVVTGSQGIYLKATSNVVTWCDNTYNCTGSGTWGYYVARQAVSQVDGAPNTNGGSYSCMLH